MINEKMNKLDIKSIYDKYCLNKDKYSDEISGDCKKQEGFCEWELWKSHPDGISFLIPSCSRKSFSILWEIDGKDYKYCPNCGKRIKMEE